MWSGLGVCCSALLFADRENLGVPQAMLSNRCHNSSCLAVDQGPQRQRLFPGEMLVLHAHVMPLRCDKALTTYPRSHSVPPMLHTCVSDERHSATTAHG
jgi:hypothetical protein